MFVEVGTLICALWYRGTSVLELKDLHLLFNCLKYLSFRFSAMSFMLTASVLHPSSRSEADWSKQTCIFPRGMFGFFLEGKRFLPSWGHLHFHSILTQTEYVLVLPDHRQTLVSQDKVLVHTWRCL